VQGLFVTGTDTEVGKTVVSAAILAALRARGTAAVGLKPLITGLDEPAGPVWPRDHELLAELAGRSPDEVTLAAFGPPVSPHLAAEAAGRPAPTVQALGEWVRGRASEPEPVTAIVEGVGGLLVPFGPDRGQDVRALAAELGLPLLIVARAGLGTINHTLLTLEAARTRGLSVAGVVLNRWPAEPGMIERSNLETIARLGAVEVATVGEVTGPAPDALAAAGAGLPLDRWIGRAAGAG
jgi:dethiobiotin synthetase